MKTRPSAERLAQLFTYDPDTGMFSRTAPRGGCPAGPVTPSKNSDGYLRVMVDKRHYYLHQLAWVMMAGDWPTRYIDHINRQRDDNRWANLREVSGSQNAMNSAVQSRNSSGHRGVRWHKAAKKWYASVNAYGKTHYLGLFTDLEEASQAAASERAKLHTFYIGAATP